MPKKKSSATREELKNTLNFFGIVAFTLVFMSFLVGLKFNAMVVYEGDLPEFAFCDSPDLDVQSGVTKVSCDNWIDVSAYLKRLDGVSLIIKKGNMLIYSLGGNNSQRTRVIGNTFKYNSCLNVRPDYEGKMSYRMVNGACPKDSTLIDYTFNFLEVNDEISKMFGYPLKTRVKTISFDASEVLEIDAIFSANITDSRNAQEKEYEVNGPIPALLAYYGGRFLDILPNFSNSQICKGCFIEDRICLNQRSIYLGKYCNTDNLLVERKKDKSDCYFAYECSNNSCIKGKCSGKSLIQRIIEAIKRIFS
ncbi:MAG: hypothetical protein V1660_03310 [archaeon]